MNKGRFQLHADTRKFHLSVAIRVSSRKRIEVDVAHYQQVLDTSGLTAEQKHDFFEALGTIVVAFIDLGYGVHPTRRTLSADVAKDKMRAVAWEYLHSSNLPTIGGPHE